MKKYRLLEIFLFVFILVGCTKKDTLSENINTIVEENKNILIGINYPITGFKSFDKEIQKDIETIYNDFKKEYENFPTLNEEAELNIDYTYNIVNNNYINICVNVFVGSSNLAHPYEYIKTYIYDIKEEHLMSLEDIISKENMPSLIAILNSEIIKNYNNCLLLSEFKQKVTNDYSNYPLFTFDQEYLTIYFNPAEITASSCGIVSVDIPLANIQTKINIYKEEKQTVSKEVQIPSKVIDPNKKVVALTFDDGPSKYTREIIEYLKKEDVVATFFILGNKVEIYKETLQDSLKYGNELGNHSYNHKWLTKLEVEELLLQIDKTQSIINEYTGYTPTIFRPTYGSVNNKIRNNIDLDIILWNIDTMDWKYKSVDKITNRATKNVKDGDIILMHDTYKTTYEAVKKIVPILKEKGFEFVTISELKEVNLLRNKQEIENE